MRIPLPALRLDREGWPKLAGASASVAVAVALYTRYSINGTLSRDEGIYAYGGQQMTHGVAPYASIFDPKAPLATMLSGFGAAAGHVIGVNDVKTIRLVFFACAVLSVLAMYLLVARLWNSVLGGVAAAVVFASFQGYARDALAGPDAKTPGILFLIVAMWLTVRRQWFWAAFAGSLAFLVWQPFAIYPVVAIVGAVVQSRGRRLRALGLAAAGAAVPLVATLGYFVSAGAFGKFFESAFAFPLRGVHRPDETIRHRVHRLVGVVDHFYKFSATLFWIGLLLLAVIAVMVVAGARSDLSAALRDPFLLIVVVTFLVQAAYASLDFQSYPDVFPLLPYPAIGFGAATALALRRLTQPNLLRAATAVVLVAATVLTALSWSWFGNSRANDNGLVAEQATACAIKALLIPGTSLYSLGNPVPLVLTDRRNPDRYLYLGSGVDRWKVKHTKGGFAGWTAQVQASRPSVIVIDDWLGKWRTPMMDWLISKGYRGGHLGPWRVLLSPEAHVRARGEGLRLTRAATKWPLTTAGTNYTDDNCGKS